MLPSSGWLLRTYSGVLMCFFLFFLVFRLFSRASLSALTPAGTRWFPSGCQLVAATDLHLLCLRCARFCVPFSLKLVSKTTRVCARCKRTEQRPFVLARTQVVTSASLTFASALANAQRARSGAQRAHGVKLTFETSAAPPFDWSV